MVAANLQKVVSDNVRMLCAFTGMMQKDLARAAGLDKITLSRRMSGKTAWKVEELGPVAAVFHVEPWELLIDREYQRPSLNWDNPVQADRLPPFHVKLQTKFYRFLLSHRRAVG